MILTLLSQCFTALSVYLSVCMSLLSCFGTRMCLLIPWPAYRALFWVLGNTQSRTDRVYTVQIELKEIVNMALIEFQGK